MSLYGSGGPLSDSLVFLWLDNGNRVEVGAFGDEHLMLLFQMLSQFKLRFGRFTTLVGPLRASYSQNFSEVHVLHGWRPFRALLQPRTN